MLRLRIFFDSSLQGSGAAPDGSCSQAAAVRSHQRWRGHSFLLFNACYLHDISMVIHPNIASFNDSNTKSEQLISKWLKRMMTFNERIDYIYKSDKFAMDEIHRIRKEMGFSLIEAFQDFFDFFENCVHLSQMKAQCLSVIGKRICYLSSLNLKLKR